MGAPTIRIRAVRPFFALRRLYPADAVHSFDLATAADILAAGRGECVDAGDAARVREFVAAEAQRVAAAIARAAPPRRGLAGYF